MEKQNVRHSLKNESKTCIFFMLVLNGINITIRIIKFDNNIITFLKVSHPKMRYSFALIKHKCFHGGVNIFGHRISSLIWGEPGDQVVIRKNYRKENKKMESRLSKVHSCIVSEGSIIQKVASFPPTNGNP